MHSQGEKALELSRLSLERAAQLPLLEGGLFVEHAIYTHHALIELAVAEYYLGRHEAALARYEALLRRPDLPGDIVELIYRNVAFSRQALG